MVGSGETLVMARPTKLTTKVARGITERMRGGASLAQAAEAEGVADRTAREWVQRGESGDTGIYGAFARDIRNTSEGESMSKKQLTIHHVEQKVPAIREMVAARSCGHFEIEGRGTVYVVDIDQELALALLAELDADQRALGLKPVQRMAQEMSEGSWKWMGNPILLNAAGKMVDGQHRCTSITRAPGFVMEDALVIFLESSGGTREQPIDLGTGRGSQFYRTVKVSRALAAGVLFEHAGLPVSGGYQANYSTKQQGDIQSACPHLEELRTINATARRHRNRELMAGHVAGALACIKAGGDQAVEFLEAAMSNPVIKGKLCPQAEVLGAYIATGRDRKSPAYMPAACVIKCWNAYVAGHQIKTLRHLQGQPVPKATAL